MNKKILGLIAASVTVFGTAITATPAKANVEQQVEVEVNVAPALFLRTFDRVEINVTQNATTSSDTVAGGPVETLTATQLTDGGPGLLDAVESITPEIPTLFAVWGNSGTVTATVEPTAGSEILTLQGTPSGPGFAGQARISSAQAVLPNNTLTPGFAVVGGATLEIEFGSGTNDTFNRLPASAGQYTGGRLTVRAVQP